MQRPSLLRPLHHRQLLSVYYAHTYTVIYTMEGTRKLKGWGSAVDHRVCVKSCVSFTGGVVDMAQPYQGLQ